MFLVNEHENILRRSLRFTFKLKKNSKCYLFRSLMFYNNYCLWHGPFLRFGIGMRWKSVPKNIFCYRTTVNYNVIRWVSRAGSTFIIIWLEIWLFSRLADDYLDGKNMFSWIINVRIFDELWWKFNYFIEFLTCIIIKNLLRTKINFLNALYQTSKV